ncbi:LOW QUALITY PROTEIN: hypothetical protein HZS_5833 [Henneguya salminicola]|nr:LOW QUALITY PROTEIN: hypothetical protein HZS_5833 [Henneguya salminicola]
MPSINDRRINHHSNSSKSPLLINNHHRSRRKHGGDSNSSDSSSPYSSDDQSNEDKNSQRHKTRRHKSPIATIAHSLILSELPSNINYEDLIKSLLEIRCTYKKILYFKKSKNRLSGNKMPVHHLFI